MEEKDLDKILINDKIPNDVKQQALDFYSEQQLRKANSHEVIIWGTIALMAFLGYSCMKHVNHANIEKPAQQQVQPYQK